MKWITLFFPLVLTACDPLGSAHVDIGAAQAVSGVADQLDTSIQEYHGDIKESDSSTKAEAIGAFVERLVRHNGDETKMKDDASIFAEALAKIDADAETERDRYSKAKDNVNLLRNLASRLNQFAVNSMTFNDEYRRYLSGMWDQVQAAKKAGDDKKAANDATREQQKKDLQSAGENAIKSALQRRAQ